jgi:hypothetical protein
MPSLPLIDAAVSQSPLAWHRVRTPGGYESWHFEAQSDDGHIHLIATLIQGDSFHPEYLRRLDAYLALPTQNAPPTPAEYPCVRLQLFVAGVCLARTVAKFPQNLFLASANSVAVGENHSQSDSRGISLHVEGVTNDDAHLAVDLLFRLQRGESTIEIAAPAVDRKHFWSIAQSLGEAAGEIRLQGSPAIPFSGQGHIDHRYGALPLGHGMRRWMRGTILLDRDSAGFAIAWPAINQTPLAKYFIAGAEGIADVDGSALVLGDDRHKFPGLGFPQAIDLGRDLLLRRPRVADSSPASLALVYDGFIRGESGTAYCEIFYPRRLRWPVVGKREERAIRVMRV